MSEFKGVLNGVPVKVVIEGAQRLNFVDTNGETVGSWHYERPALTSTVTEYSLRVRSFTCAFDLPTTAAEVLRLYDPTPEVAPAQVSKSPVSENTARVTRGKSPAFERAAWAARVVERFGWFSLVTGTLVGLYLMTQSAQVEGLLVIFSSLSYGSATVMVSAYIQGRAEQ